MKKFKTTLLRISILILIVCLSTSCIYTKAKDRYVYSRLSNGIISGSVYKGMAHDDIVEYIGKPSEMSNPTIFNGDKTQILIYKSSEAGDTKTYYLYLKNDKLIEWKLY